MRFALPSRVAAALAAAALLALAVPARAATPFGPLPPHNPYAGPDGTATMHGDTGSSDTTRLPGPPAGPLTSHRTALQSACPTVLVGYDGFPVALCTTILGRTPTVHLLDPDDGESLAELPLAKGSLLGGVYAYLDDRDRLVAVDGHGDLLRIGHHRSADGDWELTVDSRLPLAGAVPAGDAVVGISPDWQGRVWFATGGGVVGTADERTGAVRGLALPAGERIANSISTAPAGTLVATTHATYLLTAGADGTPRTAGRQAYDRGPGRKPGQLSWGTGSTPTFFGPRTGTDYTTIVDNAAPTVHLLVYRTSDGSPVCSVPVLRAGGSGSENSPIGAGNSVFISSTNGYPYPALPAEAGPSVPASADFRGGFSRVDVRPDGSGCDLVWDTTVRSAAVPRLSTGDGLIHTVLRKPLIPGSTATTVLDPYYYAEIDPATGAVGRTRFLGAGFLFDTLQMVGSIAPGGVVYQGTTTGVLRISAE
ncbi:hypothetical protein ACFV4F_38025 [Kitasatospora sp. NPDC059722]|uniref:hypothetical protein n=1 Tax=Kitasatospora sp. NPDC059722 TaxID=3346925 RepID=UPI0036B95B8C